MSIFSKRLSHVNCKTWLVNGNGFQFPELGDPQFQLDHLLTRPNVGIAFSGGGTRSASATLGQLRALHYLGLLDSARYISCVSGGSWACVPYTFLPRPNADETFLGPLVEPGDLTRDRLENPQQGSFAYVLSRSTIIDDFIEHGLFRLAGDETYSRALGDIFLEPFGIDSLKRFFTQDRDSLAKILAANPHMNEDDFYLAKHSRPYLVVGATFLHTPALSFTAKKYQMEITPLYTGLYQDHGNVGVGRHHIGGGYLETFGFDSEALADETADASGRLTVKLGARRHRFTLSDTIGTSGAAPAEVLDELHLDFLGFPEFRYWPVEEAQHGDARTIEYEFGDGGNLENLGVIPLLLRGVEKMVVFINTKHPLESDSNINTSLLNLFGQDPGFMHNQVFRKDQFAPLVANLRSKNENGEPALHKDTFRVVRNRNFGVEPGEVEVLWVYNERVEKWEQQLLPEVSDLLQLGQLHNFPHYKTFFQNPPKPLDLTPVQAELLANLSCYNVMENETPFRQIFS